MSNLINVTNQNGNLVVSSREVAENFEREHKNVLSAIATHIHDLEYIDGSKVSRQKMFIESKYSNRGKEYPEYLMNRDGFSLLVMGFNNTKKVLQWKLKYIEAFNKMEQALKEQSNLSSLSPQLQLLINMELKQRELETAVTETKEEVQAIRDVIVINPNAGWRTETNSILNAIGKKLDDYSKARKEVYEALKVRANCRPNVLINNLKKRALENGMAPSKADKLNILDVLENDARLREIYITIVKEMAIRHKIA